MVNALLQDGAIHLRQVEESDLSQFRDWRNSKKNIPYFREYRLLNGENQKQWFEKINNDRNQVNFSIVVGIKLVGHCGLYNIDWVSRNAEFGIYVGEGKGKGYGKKALGLLVDYGFNVLNLHKIWCEVFDNNKAFSFYKKFGFTHEGTLRDNHFWGGDYMDSYIMSMLRDEWIENHSNSVLDEVESGSSVIK